MLIDRLRSGWQRLTEPAPRITDPETRQRSRLLNMMILLLPILTVVLLLLSGLFYPLPGFQTPQQVVIVSVTAAILLVFVINRQGYYVLAVILLLALVTTAIVVAAHVGDRPDFALLNLIVPVLIASTFLALRWAVLLAVVLAAGLLTTPQVLGHFVTLTLLILFMHQGLLLLERWRRQALIEREERYRQVAELMSDFTYGVWVEPDNTLVLEWVTGAFEQITGYSDTQITLEKWEQIIHPDDRAYMFEQREKMLASGVPLEREFRIIAADGAVRWLHEFIRIEWDYQQGRVVAAHGAMRDITSAKEAEAAEHEQRILAEALRDTATALNSTLSFDEVLDRIIANLGRVVRYDACSIMFIEDGIARTVRHRGFEEYDPNQVLSEHLFRVQEVRSLREMSATGQPVLVPNTHTYEGWVRMPISDWIASFLGVPIKQDGVVIGFLNLDSRQENGFSPQDAEHLKAFADQVSIALRNARVFEALIREAVDLEQRVVAHTVELDREKRQLATLLDSMGEGMIYSEGQTIKYVNPAITTIIGCQPGDMVDRSLADFPAQTDRLEGETLYDVIQAAVANNPVWRGDVRLRNFVGAEIDIGMTVSRVNEPDDPVVQVVMVLRDVATEKALQAQRERFISITSHELRTPITNILTRLYLLQRQPEKQAEHLAVLESVGQRMKRLVDDLLDLPQYENSMVQLALEPVVMQDLIAAVVAVQQAEAELKRITLAVVQPDRPVSAAIDFDRMVQVLTNLVINAIHYTPAGGRIEIGLENTGTDVRVHVSDSGPGIPAKYLEDIFKPFFRIPEREKAAVGSGLGLSIVREIVLLHGGDIRVSSSRDGTCFTIRLKGQH